MILAVDIGNSQIYGGLFDNGKLLFKFRKVNSNNSSSDELGLFLKSVLRENGYVSENISEIGICSVVPDVIHSMRNCSLRYFNIDPFILGPGAKTKLQIKYRNPLEVGADRISNAIAALTKFPNQNLIIIDLGTATTFCAISDKKEYLGGAITPGLKISMNSLEENTAKLPKVEIVRPEQSCGRSTVESIQSGLFYGNLGIMKELISRITSEKFNNKKPLVIGTGGFSSMYSNDNVFDVIEPDLVLDGIYQAIILNK